MAGKDIGKLYRLREVGRLYASTDKVKNMDRGIRENDQKYVVLIIYDIVSNKQRVKMAKLLSSYGTRVQKSAFEARLSKKQYNKLLKDIQRMLKQDDNVRIYRMTGYEEIRTFGSKEYETFDDVVII